MISFNVLTEPWIPAVDRKGQQREYGLLELLDRAHELQAIVDSAPPIQLGIYRLVITFVQDALGVYEFEDLEDILLDGVFDQGRLRDYVEGTGYHRFDLFDPGQPFLQSRSVPGDDVKPGSVVNLFYHLPAGNNLLHFVHAEENEHAVSPAVAARALCSIAPFMTQGGRGQSPSINGAPPWYVLALGENLFKTILYNCCVMSISGLDQRVPPAWASDSYLEPGAEKVCYSLAEGYTWQPRQVRLLPSEGGICTYSGEVSSMLIRKMVWGAGHKFGGHDTWLDPQVPYRHDEKWGTVPLRPREDRELWRDYGPLFLLRLDDGGTEGFSRPIIVEQLASLKREQIVAKDEAEQFEIYGMRTSQAKIFEWQYERLPLRTGVLENTQAGAQVDYALELAEKVASNLYGAIKRLYPRNASGNRGALNRLIQMAQMKFWAELKPFFEGVYLEELSEQRVDDETARQLLLYDWKKTLRSLGWSCLDKVLQDMDTGATALQRQVSARDFFASAMARVLGDAGRKTEGGNESQHGEDEIYVVDN